MHKKWYKIKRGLCNDPVLGVVAKRSGLSRAECAALYLCLMDAASPAQGSLATLDAEEISVLLGIEQKRIDGGIAAFRDKKIISDDNKIGSTAARPSASTLRVRALRARRKTEIPAKKVPVGQGPAGHDNPDAVAARRARLSPAFKPPA